MKLVGSSIYLVLWIALLATSCKVEEVEDRGHPILKDDTSAIQLSYVSGPRDPVKNSGWGMIFGLDDFDDEQFELIENMRSTSSCEHDPEASWYVLTIYDEVGDIKNYYSNNRCHHKPGKSYISYDILLKLSKMVR